MSELGGLLARGRSVAAEHPGLAAVPLTTALLAVGKIRRVAEFRGTHGGISFTFPTAIVDVWAFVSVPNGGVEGPNAVPLALLPVFAVLNGVLAAGYLGAIRDALRDEKPAFVAGVRRHGVALVGYQLLTLAAVLLFALPGTAAPLLLVVVVPALLVAAYLFYGTPYLVVAREQSLLTSLEDSYRLATGGGAYAALFFAVLLGGAAVSLFATPVVVNLGLAGVLLGAVVLAPVGVVVNATTMALFLRIQGTGAAPATDQGAGGGPTGRNDPAAAPTGGPTDADAKPGQTRDTGVPPANGSNDDERGPAGEEESR